MARDTSVAFEISQPKTVTSIVGVADDGEPAEVFISDPLVTPRPLSHLLTLIVCGDCAGDDRVPRKTLLAANSTCVKCGGRSYVLASKLHP